LPDFFSSTPAPESNFADTVCYEVVKTNERLAEVVEELITEPLLAVDTENSTIDPNRGWPLLLQIGTSDKCFIFEAYREELDFSPLKKLLENEKILKIFFHAKYDWKWIFVHYGISVDNLFCCQVVERLLTVGLPNAFRRPSLRGVTQKYLGIELRKEARSGFINRDPEADPITDTEFAYSAADVVMLPDIYYQQMINVEELNLQRVVDLENRVILPLAEAEVTGITIDQSKWRELLKEAQVKHKEVSVLIYRCFDKVISQKTLFGIPTFKISSTPQLLKNLKRLGYELPDTEVGTLRKYKNKHIVFEHLLKWRKYQKTVTSYGEKLLQKINKKTGRLHCQFNQLEADTGRMSAEKPNLQQVPGFDPTDPDSLDFRGCFITVPKYKLITVDFGQQELRILADMSGDPTFYKAYTELDEEGKALDVHRYTASVVFDIPYKDVSKKQRVQAKTLNFFLVFGGGAFSLAETLKISEEEAQKIIDDYFMRYSKIKSFLDSCGSAAISKGFAETISGRKRFICLPDPTDPAFHKERKRAKRKGKNTPIQGSGADVTKMALVFLYERLKREGYDATILMIVHDEFVVEAREDQAEEVSAVVEEEMIRGYSHFFKNIPMVVDAHVGPTWEK